MKDKLYTPATANELTEKKVWQTPVVEIISRDNIKSGDHHGVEGSVIDNSSGDYLGNGHS